MKMEEGIGRDTVGVTKRGRCEQWCYSIHPNVVHVYNASSTPPVSAPSLPHVPH